MKPAWPEQINDTKGYDYMLWLIASLKNIKR